MKIFTLQDARVENKTVLLRLDMDVPISFKGEIEDDTRLQNGIETIRYLLDKRVKIVAVGHLGRPGGVDRSLSLIPIAKWYSRNIKNNKSQIENIENTTLQDFAGWKIGGQFILLENIRFFKEEEKNDIEFAESLSKLVDIYVNDAFAASHRMHASIVGITRFLPHYAGFRLQKEVEVLDNILNYPRRPLVVVIGGAKLETKLPLVEKMHQLADFVLVGGKIAQEVRTLLKVQHEKVKERKSVLLVADLNEIETDVTLKSLENFLQIIALAKTVIWNGPVGKVNSELNEETGTVKLAEGIVKSKAYTVVGGGDTLLYLRQINLLNKFDFVSSGGGAMLAFLSGEKLPGIEVLKKS